jgi:hypothetical protein
MIDYSIPTIFGMFVFGMFCGVIIEWKPKVYWVMFVLSMVWIIIRTTFYPEDFGNSFNNSWLQFFLDMASFFVGFIIGISVFKNWWRKQ